MNFSQDLKSRNQTGHVAPSVNDQAEVVEHCEEDIKASTDKFIKHREMAEERISRGARITEHRIKL